MVHQMLACGAFQRLAANMIFLCWIGNLTLVNPQNPQVQARLVSEAPISAEWSVCDEVQRKQVSGRAHVAEQEVGPSPRVADCTTHPAYIWSTFLQDQTLWSTCAWQ